MRVSCPSVGLPASTRSPACLPAKAASCIPSVLQPASSQTKTSLDIHRLNAIKAIAVVSSPRRTRRAYPARTDFTARSQLVFLKSQRLACLRLASRLKGPIVTVGEMPPPHNHPLAAACYYDQPDVVKALLASGADPLFTPPRKFSDSAIRSDHRPWSQSGPSTFSRSSSHGRVVARRRRRRPACFLLTRSPTNKSRRCWRVTTPSTRRARSSGGRMVEVRRNPTSRTRYGSGLMSDRYSIAWPYVVTPGRRGPIFSAPVGPWMTTHRRSEFS